MTDEIQQFQAILRASTSPAQRPTAVQILEIAKLTYVENACQTIQEMIHRRLESADFYQPKGILHTLILIQKCLPIASQDFVNFCTKEVHLVIALTHYEKGDTPADREIDKLVRDRASALAKLILDPSELAQKRGSTSIATPSVTSHKLSDSPGPFLTPTDSSPNTTAPDYARPQPAKRSVSLSKSPESSNSTHHPPLNPKLLASLPTPPPSPEKTRKPALQNHKPARKDLSSQLTKTPIQTPRNTPVASNLSEPRRPIHEGNCPATQSMLLLEEGVVAKMTFTGAQLNVVWKCLNECLSSDLSSSEDVLRALNLVEHCLLWGSDEFVAICQEAKDLFYVWSQQQQQHVSHDIRGLAEDIWCHLVLQPEKPPEGQEKISRLNSTAWDALSGTTLGPSSHASESFSAHTGHPRPSAAIQVSQAHHIPIDQQPHIQPSHNIKPLPKEKGVQQNIHSKESAERKNYVSLKGSRPVRFGGRSDVWKGEYKKESRNVTTTVAVKIFRRTSKSPTNRLRERLNEVLKPRRSLKHENIVPLYGTFFSPEGDVGLVSPFYDKWNVVEYMSVTTGVDPMVMLKGIVEGISYLHAQKFVHGNLKGTNVMINDVGVPKLIDCGLSQIMEEFVEEFGFAMYSNSFRWSAPELLIGEPQNTSKTEKSDIYAFASTCVEIMTYQCPYYGQSDAQVLKHVLTGRIPDRPLSDEKYWNPCDELWNLITACWSITPKDRPNIDTVKRTLSEFYTTPPSGIVPTESASSTAAWKLWKPSEKVQE